MAKLKVFRYSDFDLDALLALASRLRKQACSCDTSKPPLAGSLNWVIFVSFDDGVEWVFRSPYSGARSFFSDEYTCRLVSSEVATLKYLKAHSAIPVPEVFAYSASRENDVGVPYILMSRAPGHSLSEYDWMPSSHPELPRSTVGGTRPLSDEGRKKVMRQLGAMTWQLLRLRFGKIRSVFQDQAGNYTIGECLSPSLTWHHRDSLENVDRGPYDHESEYIEALVSAYMSHAKELTMTPHAFFAPIPDPAEYATWAGYRNAAARWNDFVAVGQKIDHSKNRLAYCVAGQLMREMIPNLFPSRSPGDDHDHDGFPLGHPDLHFGNIFVDDNLNITCVIDWGSASSVPVSELLAAHGILRTGGGAIEDSFVAAFKAGFDQASGPVLEVGPRTWQRAAVMRLFQRLVRMLSTQDYHEFEALHALAFPKEDEGGDEGEVTRDIAALFSERVRQSENKRLLAELSQDDMSPDEVARHERVSFGKLSPATTERMAVARKLTLMAEMNDRFVADRRLWCWVEEALKDTES